jgi:hypothetical protein
MKTNAKKINAQRAARAAGLKDGEFEIVKAKDGFAYQPKAVPPPKEEPVKNVTLPEPPDFSAKTHARFRGKLAKLIELAEAGDIAGLKAIRINPVSTSPKAMARYRDLCVVALEARQ